MAVRLRDRLKQADDPLKEADGRRRSSRCFKNCIKTGENYIPDVRTAC